MEICFVQVRLSWGAFHSLLNSCIIFRRVTKYCTLTVITIGRYDQPYYREAKQLVYKMLTEGDGKNVAIVSTDHLRYCKKIFAELTHHQFEKVELAQINNYYNFISGLTGTI